METRPCPIVPDQGRNLGCFVLGLPDQNRPLKWSFFASPTKLGAFADWGR
jgi:hypothetical protein